MYISDSNKSFVQALILQMFNNVHDLGTEYYTTWCVNDILLNNVTSMPAGYGNLIVVMSIGSADVLY